MFEAKLSQGNLLRKVMDAMKDLVAEANWDCSSDGITMQAMDSSHVSLVHMEMRSEGFDPFRCDKNTTLGIDLKGMTKMMKCGGGDDSITLRAQDNSDTMTFVFESQNQERTSQFEMKLMDIDSERLGIPDSEPDAVVRMPSNEFQRIIRDLTQFGDSVIISCTKEGVQFVANGDSGSGKITIRQNSSVDKQDDETTVELQEPVNLTFAFRYLAFFTKATSLSPTVTLSLKAASPLVCEYKIEDFGFIRFYLAPKIEEDEE